MNDRELWRERVRDIRASGTTWWWWWWFMTLFPDSLWPEMVDLSMGKLVECSPIAQETGVQSQVESYQRLKKWYWMPPCLTLNIIRYISSVSGAIQGKESRSFQHFSVIATEKGASGSPQLQSPTFTLDRNTWNHITVCKQIIFIL